MHHFIRTFILCVTSCLLTFQIRGQNVPNAVTFPTSGTVTDILPGSYNGNSPIYRTAVNIVRKPITDTSLISSLAGADISSIIKYADGLGRTIQTVQRQASSGLDIISIDYYDSLGQQPFQFLTAAIAGTTGGEFQRNVFYYQNHAYQTGFFNTNYGSTADNDTAYAYGKIKYDFYSKNRAVKIFRPGFSKVGSNVGTERTSMLNADADSVKMWRFNGVNAFPTSNSNWPRSNLYVTLQISEDGIRSRQFQDREGKTILIQRQDSTVANAISWLSTYLIYDEYDRLRQVIPPKANQLIKDNNGIITQSIFDNLLYSYDYDNRGRMFYKKLPGRSPINIVFDKRDRQVLFQDGNNGQTKKWNFVKYDINGRPIISGRFNNPNQWTRSFLASIIDNASYNSAFIQFIATDLVNNNYTTSSTISDAEIHTLTYYDDYTSAPNVPYNSTYVDSLPHSINSDISIKNNNPYALTTGQYIRVMDGDNPTNNWESITLFYDTKGRTIQTHSVNFKGGHDVQSFHYNFSGQPVSTFASLKNPAATSGFTDTVKLLKVFLYDNDGRLKKTLQKLNDEPYYRQLNDLTYDFSGRVKSRILGGNAETQQYKYRIWGDIESINKGFYLNTDTAHFFGEIVNYDYGFVQTSNTQPSGIKWRMKGSYAIQRSYGYRYDDNGRLTNADYRQTNGSGWSKSQEDYSAINMHYDANGNMLHMTQYGTKAGFPFPFKMDDLTYNYKDNNVSNQLDAVTDAVTLDYQLGDFTEASSGTGDYTYDNNGNSTKDANKGITSITFNNNDKPCLISFTNNRQIKFIYDAIGSLLSKQVTENGATLTTDYLGLLEFNNNKLTAISHEQGVTRPVLLTLANNTTKWAFEYDYNVKDHLGNVRSTITEEPDSNWYSPVIPDPYGGGSIGNIIGFTPTAFNPTTSYQVISGFTVGSHNYVATSELSNGTIETYTFSNIDETRDDKPGSSDSIDVKAARLNSADGRTVGPAIMLKVMAGDEIGVRTEAYYDLPEENNYGDPVPEDNIVSGLLSVMSGGGTYSALNETGMSEDLIYGAVAPASITEAIGYLSANTVEDPSKPKAYLNYIFFDQNFQFVPELSHRTPVGPASGWGPITPTLDTRVTLDRNGWIFVFSSNQSGTDVYFDNLELEHYKGKLISESHYYPYGLTITNNAITQSPENKHLFTGSYLNKAEFSNGKGLNWYDMNARQYDPQIGRWHSYDLLAENASNWSPYRYAYCNPAVYTDHSGMGEDVDYNGDGEDSWGYVNSDGGHYETATKSSSGPNQSQNPNDTGYGYDKNDNGELVYEESACFPPTVVDVTVFVQDNSGSGGGDNYEGDWEPLDKATYESYVSNRYYLENGSRLTPGTLQNKAGEHFENAWHKFAVQIHIAGYIATKASDRYPTFLPQRANVNPDGIAWSTVFTTGAPQNYYVRWFEVKQTYKKNITASSFEYQAEGEAAALFWFNPFAAKQGWSSLTFVTTSNTTISPLWVKSIESRYNLSINQVISYYKMYHGLMYVTFIPDNVPPEVIKITGVNGAVLIK